METSTESASPSPSGSGLPPGGSGGSGAPPDVQPSPSDAPITIREMMEAGVHFGHQTKRWNPKMKSFIFGARNGIHIIDLQQTVRAFKRAYNFLVQNVAQGRSVLFVGTKKQAQETIELEAGRAGQPFVTNRWLGGTLTNFRTIKGGLDRLRTLERMREDGTHEQLPKKEVVQLEKERARLEKYIGGLKGMGQLPQAVFVIDPAQESIAVNEARKLHIPIVAITDTNCDPDLVDYIIPGNDDAIRSVRLILSAIVQAVGEAKADYDSKRARGGKSADPEQGRERKAGEGFRIDEIAQRIPEQPLLQIELPQGSTPAVERPPLFEVGREGRVPFDSIGKDGFARIHQGLNQGVARVADASPRSVGQRPGGNPERAVDLVVLRQRRAGLVIRPGDQVVGVGLILQDHERDDVARLRQIGLEVRLPA
jgi:small subunit ribosomal protein S2